MQQASQGVKCFEQSWGLCNIGIYLEVSYLQTYLLTYIVKFTMLSRQFIVINRYVQDAFITVYILSCITFRMNP